MASAGSKADGNGKNSFRNYDARWEAGMLLPIRTAPEDIEAICGYLLTKPAGLSPSEVINHKKLDSRKVSALKLLGLVEDAIGKLTLSPRGWLVAADGGAQKAGALREILLTLPPYASIIARAIERNETIMLASDIAGHWQQDFRAYLHFHAGVLNHQIVCFLRLAEAAGLGRLVVGRKGKETRFELDGEEAAAFLRAAGAGRGTDRQRPGDGEVARPSGFTFPMRRTPRVFITCRTGGKILEQVEELVAFGQIEPIVFRRNEAATAPLLSSLMEQMRGCDTAIVQVDALREAEPHIQADMLIEIGAAMALFGRNFVLLVEDSVALPLNLQGVCECRYRGDELNMVAMMELLRAFSGFTRSGAKAALPDLGHVIAQALPRSEGTRSQ
jgi:Predicted nucleotide-binding protein containing TIR-like domain